MPLHYNEPEMVRKQYRGEIIDMELTKKRLHKLQEHISDFRDEMESMQLSLEKEIAELKRKIENE